MALGYRKFWTLVLDELGLEIDDAFASSLEARDLKKGQKRKKEKSKKGKISRRKTGLVKYKLAHQEQMSDVKSGKIYGSSVVLATLTKKATEKFTAAIRNPKGTSKHLSRCVYYPIYCTVLGHTTVANKLCGMNKTRPRRGKISFQR